MQDNRAILEVESFDIGLDWATFSAPADEAKQKRFRDFGHAYMQEFGATRSEGQRANVRDYAGTRISDTYFVRRPSDGHMLLIASGAEAVVLAEEVTKSDLETHPTRLDIAATARAVEPNPDYPGGLRDAILRARASEGKKQRQIMAVFEHKAGFTGLCIGSRSSEVYGRVYDWHAKHSGRHSFQLWRHEIEYKGGAARRLWQSYRYAQEPKDVCIATVADRLDKWRIPASWLPDKGRLEIMQERKESDTERRLKYVRSVVAPMLVKLVEEGQTDAIRDILKAAGLEELFKPYQNGLPE